MSDIVLRSTVRARAELHSLVETLKQRLREQDGQDTVEYIGVLVLVAAIIAGVFAFIPGVESTLQTDVTHMISDIFNGTKPGK